MGTVGYPIIPASGGFTPPDPPISDPIPRTWLSLDRYAKILGINPVHFWGSVGAPIWPFQNNACNNIWPSFNWQASDQVSRYDLATSIKQAEDEISSFLGYLLAPTWVTREPKRYPRYYRPELVAAGGINARGYRKGVKAKWGKVIAPGRRATTLVGTATMGVELIYSDEDSDGFAETATITISTSVTDACELKVYSKGTAARPEWEIRDARSKSVSGGTATLVFDSWLFIHPDMLGRFPSDDGFSAVDISTTDNFVDEVDIYREYNDNTAVSAQFFWEPEHSQLTCADCGGSGCVSCTHVTQDGCLLVRDVNSGYVVPSPATYDATSGQWLSNVYSVGRDPDQVKIWYYAGEMDEAYLSGDSCEPLSDFFAKVIAWLATARLERPFCSCGNVTALAESWREELTKQGEVAHLFDFDLLDAPFGTRRGELMAFKALSMLGKRKISAGVI